MTKLFDLATKLEPWFINKDKYLLSAGCNNDYEYEVIKETEKAICIQIYSTKKDNQQLDKVDSKECNYTVVKTKEESIMLYVVKIKRFWINKDKSIEEYPEESQYFTSKEQAFELAHEINRLCDNEKCGQSRHQAFVYRVDERGRLNGAG